MEFSATIIKAEIDTISDALAGEQPQSSRFLALVLMTKQGMKVLKARIISNLHHSQFRLLAAIAR